MSADPAMMSFTYENDNPIVHVKLTIDGKERDFPAYADTGCSSAVVITKRLADSYGLREADSISEEQEAILADGSKVICRLYLIPAKIGNYETSINLIVLYPDSKTLSVSASDETHDEPLLGREIMDRFDVLFAGKSNPKVITFSNNM